MAKIFEDQIELNDALLYVEACGVRVTEKRLSSLHFEHDNREYLAVVGKEFENEGKLLAILQDKDRSVYLLCLAKRLATAEYPWQVHPTDLLPG